MCKEYSLVTESIGEMSVLEQNLKLIEGKVIAYCEFEERKRIKDLLRLYKLN
jgi:hypothetical protein